jgi:hypothetical protein
MDTKAPDAGTPGSSESPRAWESDWGGGSGWNIFWMNWWALAIVVVGILWLAGDLGYIKFDWSLAGPIFVIIFGLGMLFGGWRRRMWRQHWRAERAAWRAQYRQGPPGPP